jgi:thiamine-phosphate pyrophosphorylase
MARQEGLYTDRVRKALGLAARYAATATKEEVTPALMLAGLLAVDKSVARSMLKKLGIDVAALGGLFPPAPRTAEPVRVDRIGYSGGARLVVDSALRAARELGARHVGTEHLLIALLEAGGAEVTQALAGAGLKPTGLRLQILRQMGAAAGRLEEARLYVLLTASLASAPLFKAVQALIAGGADVIQYREKELPDGPFLANALTLRQMTRDGGVLFLINDRADVALLAQADGVHLGQVDLPVGEVRRLLGPTRIVGASTHNEREAKLALLQQPDYIAAGSIFPTTTKEAEVGGLAYLSLLLGKVKPDCPVYPIGGITLENLREVLAAGADRVAVSSAIIGAPDIRAACTEFRSRLPGAKK